tara:strand:- start:37 stop:651 length:615 start_codon:yes stop_codon:yes gene_type:complete
MAMYKNAEDIEAGVDEVARGCLAGPVYAAAVIWPKELELEDTIKLKDSKKLSKKKRDEYRDYIESTALDYSVAFESPEKVDEINILNAAISAMHLAIDGLNVIPESLLIDGNKFKPYILNGDLIPHECFIKGDDLYQSISAASILAKVYHDDYITELCEKEPELNIYEWKKNMCYGTKAHLDAIKDKGITKYHRKTFGICKEYV